MAGNTAASKKRRRVVMESTLIIPKSKPMSSLNMEKNYECYRQSPLLIVSTTFRIALFNGKILFFNSEKQTTGK